MDKQTFGNDYRVATVAKLYLTVKGINILYQ